MSPNLNPLLQQLASEPWYISDVAHAALLATQFDIVSGTGAVAEMDLANGMALAFAQRKPAMIEKDTGIAHISVFGPLARNLAPLQRATGMTDFAQIHEDFASAKASGARGILLHIDSPGGTVSGTPEAAALIAESSIPVVAHASKAGSAAYYIAAGASQIIASPSADTGSIGVMTARMDLSEAMKRIGIKADVITNTGGDLKAIGAMGSEVTAPQREHIQSMIDSMFTNFRSHVRAHRDVPDSAMRGQTFSGQAAVDTGLIDSVGSELDARAILLARLG